MKPVGSRPSTRRALRTGCNAPAPSVGPLAVEHPPGLTTKPPTLALHPTGRASPKRIPAVRTGLGEASSVDTVEADTAVVTAAPHFRHPPDLKVARLAAPALTTPTIASRGLIMGTSLGRDRDPAHSIVVTRDQTLSVHQDKYISRSAQIRRGNDRGVRDDASTGHRPGASALVAECGEQTGASRQR